MLCVSRRPLYKNKNLGDSLIVKQTLNPTLLPLLPFQLPIHGVATTTRRQVTSPPRKGTTLSFSSTFEGSLSIPTMSESSVFSKMMINFRETCRYYTGYPKDLGPSRVLHFTSERQFVQILHQGYPVVVAFTIRGNYTKHLDKVLEEAASEFYPHVKFMRVECPKYPGFCITRQKKEYPFVEIFHTPEQAASQGRVADPNVTKYSVKVLPFTHDLSAYGFREFFKRHGIQISNQE